MPCSRQPTARARLGCSLALDGPGPSVRRVAVAAIGRLDTTYAPEELATEPRSKSRASSVPFRARAFTRHRRQAKVGPNRDGRSASALRLPTRTWNEVLMTTLMELQGAIEVGMRRGESFSTVEDEIIEPSRMSDEAKSALWLYAWSFVDWRAQRREAYAHIAQIAEGPELSPAFT